jgi:hypothetical protein
MVMINGNWRKSSQFEAFSKEERLARKFNLEPIGPVWLNRAPFLGGIAMVGYPSGQRGQTVNLLADAFAGSNPAPTTISGPSRGAHGRIDMSPRFRSQ